MTVTIHNFPNLETARATLEAAARRAAEAKREDARPAVEPLRAELKFIGKYDISAAASAERPVMLKLTINRQLTPSQLLKLDALLADWNEGTK